MSQGKFAPAVKTIFTAAAMATAVIGGDMMANSVAADAFATMVQAKADKGNKPK